MKGMIMIELYITSLEPKWVVYQFMKVTIKEQHKTANW